MHIIAPLYIAVLKIVTFETNGYDMEISGVTTRMMLDYLLNLLDDAEKRKQALGSRIDTEIFADERKVSQIKEIETEQHTIRVIMVSIERMENIERLTSDYALIEDEFPFIEKHLREDPI